MSSLQSSPENQSNESDASNEDMLDFERERKLVKKLLARCENVKNNPDSPHRFNSRGEDISEYLECLVDTESDRMGIIDSISMSYPDLTEEQLMKVYIAFINRNSKIRSLQIQ